MREKDKFVQFRWKTKYAFKKQPPQSFSLMFGETGLECLSHHGGKTRCVWSKMQRDIRAGNWLIGENSICERCFVSGRGSQPSAMGLPQSQLTKWQLSRLQTNANSIIFPERERHSMLPSPQFIHVHSDLLVLWSSMFET